MLYKLLLEVTQDHGGYCLIWKILLYVPFIPSACLFLGEKRGGQQIGVWWISVLIISSAVIIIVILLLFFREGLSDTWWIHSCWGAPRNKQKGAQILSLSLSLIHTLLFWRGQLQHQPWSHSYCLLPVVVTFFL